MVAFGGGWAWVPKSLDALRRNTTAPYEVILVDNGGVAEPVCVEEPAVDVIRNSTNVGFAPGANQGAARARSGVFVFLNTDTLVEPGWLEPLLEQAAQKEVGAVFPAKLNLDGTMQEAGAFVTGEAHAYVFGDGDAADNPEYAFRREVDFGSAAAMCIARTRFQSLSGFDPSYRVAYYEDADLCFRIRGDGLRSVYEPRSRVVHARSVSVAPAELAEVYAGNRDVFLARWGDAIEGRSTYDELAADPAVRVAARDVHAPRRVLLVGTGTELERVARSLTRAHPRARVTLLVERIDPGAERELLESGVEVAAPADAWEWLAGRVGHYTHVLLRQSAGRDHADAVRASQGGAAVARRPDDLEAALTD